MSLTDEELCAIEKYEKSLHRGETLKKIISHPAFLIFLLLILCTAIAILI